METAFLEIVETHQNIIHKVCRMYRDSKEDQEDLFQEIVLQLWKGFPHFRQEAKVSSWMYRIALNTAITVFRKNKVALDFEDDLSKTAQQSQEQTSSENEEKMFEAIRKLNEVEKALIALYLEDYAYREIAGIMGISENYVGVRLNRIKNKLKNLINWKSWN